jgi:GlcNAc-P-P-Und epimerase
MKIVITGASGFIGTNLLEYFKGLGHEVFNIDIAKPKNPKHLRYWHEIDICDFESLKSMADKIQPDYVVHLAARTDLNESNGLEYYTANIEGVENIVKICKATGSVKRVIFATSMLVNKAGYLAKNTFDYNPTTLYGKSKVISEDIIFFNSENLTEFCIIRPSSIWGEWFGEPYKTFFDFVLQKKYFHLGGRACTKTYGYVGNSIFQIEKLLFSDANKVHGQVFYIGDNPANNISEWANEIAKEANIAQPKTLPYFVFVLAAFFGDTLKFFKIKFPMTSFRLRNMTTNNILNLDNLSCITKGKEPHTRVQGVKRTLKWMKELR